MAHHGRSPVDLTVFLDHAIEALLRLLQILYRVVFVTVSPDVFDDVRLQEKLVPVFGRYFDFISANRLKKFFTTTTN